MDIPQYVNRARTALQEGEFDLATRYFQQVLNQFPNNPQALQGIKDVKIALAKKRFPPWVREIKLAWLMLSVAMGRAKSAYDDIELLYQCQPDHPRTAVTFARCAEKAGKLDEAHDAYSRVLKQNATHAAALAEDAEVLVKLDRLEEAAERFQRLLAMRPNDDKLTHRLRDISARSYARTGIPENLQARRAAIEKERLEAPAPPEIMEELEKKILAYKKHPENKDLGVEIAAHYRKAEIYDAANETLAAILDKDPQYNPARREQARVWRESGELSIAQSLFKELLDETPGDLALKDAYLSTSVSLLENQCKQPGADRDAINQLERLKLERDRNRIVYLQQFIADHPEAFEERLELGSLLINGGQPNDAIPILQRVIHEPSFAGRGYFMLGQCFRSKGDVALAIQQFEKSLDFFKNRGYSHVPSHELKSVYYYLGVAKEEIGDRDGAKEAYGMVYSADINFKDVRKRYEDLFT